MTLVRNRVISQCFSSVVRKGVDSDTVPVGNNKLKWYTSTLCERLCWNGAGVGEGENSLAVPWEYLKVVLKKYHYFFLIIVVIMMIPVQKWMNLIIYIHIYMCVE